MLPAYAQAGLTELPGVPAGGEVAVGTSGTRPAAVSAAPRSTVYDDYFPIGTAPTSECAMHGAASLIGASGADTTMSSVSSLGSTSGMIAASYSAPPAPASAASSHLEKVTGPDGRSVWVVKQ